MKKLKITSTMIRVYFAYVFDRGSAQRLSCTT